MKKIFAMMFLFLSVSLFARVELFDYDLWAKDLKTIIKLTQGFDETIKGYDINHNFVRDDVENYIKDKYSNDEFQKIMFLEAAKKIQQIITLPKKTSIKVHQKLDLELLRIYTCRDYILYKHSSDIDIEQEMLNKSEFKAKVLNTSKRLKAYIAHKQKIPFAYSIPSDEELKKQKSACEELYSKIKSENKKGRVLTAK